MTPSRARLLVLLVCLLPLASHAEPPVAIANAVNTELKAGNTANAVRLAPALKDSKLAIKAAMAHLAKAKTLDATALDALDELRFRSAHAKEAAWLKQAMKVLRRGDKPVALVRLAEATAAAGAKDAATHRDAALRLLMKAVAKQPALKELLARTRVLVMRAEFARLANLPPWSGDDEKALRGQMSDALDQLGQAKKSAQAVIELKQAGAIVEAMCAITSGYEVLAARIRTMPPPKRLPKDALAMYQAELNHQAKRVADGGKAIAAKAIGVLRQHYGHGSRATACLIALDDATYPGVGPLPLPEAYAPGAKGVTMSVHQARAALALSRSGQGMAASKVTAALIRLGRWEEAHKRIQSITGTERRVARQQHGWAALGAHDYAGAATVFKEALSQEAGDGFSALGYCLALDGQRQLDDAAKCYRALPPKVRELGWDRLTLLAR